MALKPVRQTQKIESMPPPIGGINARDAISLMPETDAVDLVNWIPDTYGLRCRKGFREWAINFPTDELVQSILTYIAPGTPLPNDTFLSNPVEVPGALFAATDAGFYDITATTDTPVIDQALSDSPGAGTCSSAMVSNIAGNTLCVVSETDGYFTYNGTVWAQPVEGTDPGEINGTDPADFCFVFQWKRRLWFIARNSTSVWYTDTDAITGDVTELDLGAEFKRGGFLSYGANWTIDAGEGVDDFLVLVSSNGEVIVYKGTDPTSAATFGKVGTFFIGQVPTGRRAFSQFGGDLVLLSANGIYPMSFITRGGAQLLQATGQEYSSKIRSPMGEDLRNSFMLPGWSMVLHPSERLMLVGVPDYGGNRSRQYAMSTTQNQWTRFEGIPALCYGESFGYLFCGTTDGRVLLMFIDFFDNVEYGEQVGNGIRCVMQPAFSFFKTPALNKQFMMVRPTFLAVDRPAYAIRMAVNFEPKLLSNVPPAIPSEGALWDTAEWDVAQWAGGSRSYSNWTTVGAGGFSGSAGMVTVCTAQTVLASLDYMFQSGGPMG